MKTKEEKIQFLNDTIEYYKTNPRGIIKRDNGTTICTYAAGCAIGRHLTSEFCLKLDNGYGAAVDQIFEFLPENLKSYGKDFLKVVQQLHDSSLCWDKNNKNGFDLTVQGKQRFKNIIKDINNGSL